MLRITDLKQVKIERDKTYYRYVSEKELDALEKN